MKPHRYFPRVCSQSLKRPRLHEREHESTHLKSQNLHWLGNSLGGPVVRTRHFNYGGSGSIPDGGTKIPQALGSTAP